MSIAFRRELLFGANPPGWTDAVCSVAALYRDVYADVNLDFKSRTSY